MPRVSPKYNLQVVNPTLSKQWHPSKNADLKPENIAPKSHKKVWWSCDKGHEWEASVAKRANGQNCPYCSGRRVGADNNLAYLLPDLAKEWHPRKNHPLTPQDVTIST